MDTNLIMEPGDYGRRPGTAVDVSAKGKHEMDRSPYIKEKSIEAVISQGYSTVDINQAYNGTKSEVGLPREGMSYLMSGEAWEKNSGVKEDRYNGR